MEYIKTVELEDGREIEVHVDDKRGTVMIADETTVIKTFTEINEVIFAHIRTHYGYVDYIIF